MSASYAPISATTPDAIVFSSEPEFLEALRKFYACETSKNVYPEKASELVAWKLMLWLLRTLWGRRKAGREYDLL